MAPTDDLMDGDDLAPRAKTKPEAKKKSPMLLILIGLVVMIAAPAGTYFVMKGNAGGGEGSVSPKKIPQPVVMDIDAITVNISGTRMTRVLRMRVHLILSEEPLRKVLEEMLPMVKDRIMATAGRRTLDELESVDDRESLKRDIAMEINSLIRNRMAGSVLDVAFSEFLIQ
jgi:flagellar protein FliL